MGFRSALNRIFRTGQTAEYIPLATDMPRNLNPGNTWGTTAQLSAASGLAVGMVDGMEDGLIAAATTGVAHRVATSAAWDEYEKMRAEAEDKARRFNPQSK
jgi:hypothetical protein